MKQIFTKQELNRLAIKTLKECKKDFNKEEIEGIRRWLYNYPDGINWLKWRLFEIKLEKEVKNK